MTYYLWTKLHLTSLNNTLFFTYCTFGYGVCVCVCALRAFCVGPVHCSRDPQVLFSAKTTLKLGPTTLFTHLKIILLYCFQFSVFNNKQYPNRPLPL